MNNIGTLYLIPMPLGLTAPEASIPDTTQEILSKVDTFLAEDAKTARAYLKKFKITKPIQEIVILPLSTKPHPDDIQKVINILTSGTSIGVLSEAGCPGIADPGSIYASHAHSAGIRVAPLVGPTSIILALMASGLSGQHFTFIGYIPAEQTKRISAISHIGQIVQKTGSTHIFIETPYRSSYVLRDLIAVLPDELIVTAAIDLTTPEELIISKPISQWKEAQNLPDLNNRQTVFVIGSQATTKPQLLHESFQSHPHKKWYRKRPTAHRRRG